MQTLLLELGYDEKTVGTALNQEFVRAKDRADTRLRDGDAVEIVTPRQGG
ncbi:MAG: sulfur carrier protein ThiS [Methylocystis sp.]